MDDEGKTGLYSDGTGNKIDGKKYWDLAISNNKWTPAKKPWYSRLIKRDFLTGEWVSPLYYTIKNYITRSLPIRWKKVDGWPLTYHNIDHDEQEWKIPRDAGLYEIFRKVATLWDVKKEWENDVFSIKAVHDEDDDPTDQYIMVYKPTGLIIEWYKYPFRSSSCNKRFTRKELKEIVKHCMEEVSEKA